MNSFEVLQILSDFYLPLGLSTGQGYQYLLSFYLIFTLFNLPETPFNQISFFLLNLKNTFA